MSILKPDGKKSSLITEEDLERAERNQEPLCDEANLRVFQFWHQMGGLRRPLSPVEAAETPGPLAKDFIVLIRRMRDLADSELAFAEFSKASQHLYKTESTVDDLYTSPSTIWE